MIKLEEHACGSHIYMKMLLDNKRIEEIDACINESGCRYITSVDHGMSLYSGEELVHRKELRNQIIAAFKKFHLRNE